jgi:hypothetical protein
MSDDVKDGRFKFLNCQFRSENILQKTIKRCKCHGGNYSEEGYECSKRNIFKINPDICDSCLEFQPK